MSRRVRQGLGWALLGGVLWGVAALLALLGGAGSTAGVLLLGIPAFGGIALGVGGLAVAAVTLIRDR